MRSFSFPLPAEQSSRLSPQRELSTDCAPSTSEDLGSSGRQLVQPLVIAPLAAARGCTVTFFSRLFSQLFPNLLWMEVAGLASPLRLAS